MRVSAASLGETRLLNLNFKPATLSIAWSPPSGDIATPATSSLQDPTHVTRLEPDSDEPSQQKSEDVRFCVGECPLCKGGLCTVRAYLNDQAQLSYGLILCDECEAIWLQPDTNGVHLYSDPERPLSPVSGQPLFDSAHSRWANHDDINALGWSGKIDPTLTHSPHYDCTDA
ncbi:hypothetical protein Poly21_03380 [Allorhodopirellula heiligendammensis]|uniref:Uncharacterized protein n=1 Tax=Allorhodopirellula heiligendammensis TaxID=2714739 RepID=A0A5C6C0T9_9BACT|nr:hypothetical protein Poly21_03380 [Allorhodopirellula heiligendammensis]